jgi:hypothetical protein
MGDFSRNFRPFEFDKKGRNVVKFYLFAKIKNFSHAATMSRTNEAVKEAGRMLVMLKVCDCEGAMIE